MLTVIFIFGFDSAASLTLVDFGRGLIGVSARFCGGLRKEDFSYDKGESR